jgi:hypothetical protein
MENLIEKYKNRLPNSYLEFISKNQEFEGPLGEEFGYVNLWDVGALHEAWEGYKFQDNLSDQWFPIGSNRGGEIIVIDLSSDEKELFYIPFITQSELDADYYGDDLRVYDIMCKRGTNFSRARSERT